MNRGAIRAMNRAVLSRWFPTKGEFVLTRNITRRVPIPHEPGQWMELRRLSWTQLDQAKRARSDAAMKNLADQPGEVRELMRDTASVRSAVVEVERDPLAEYDVATLLALGIHAWSYDEPPIAEHFADLDPVTADWAAREILAPTQRTEEDRAEQMFPASPGA